MYICITLIDMFLVSQSANIGPQVVLRTSPSASPGPLLRILFDRSGDFPIWRPGDVMKWRPEDLLIWLSRYIPESSIWYVPRTLLGRPLGDLQSTQTWMSQCFLYNSFQNLFDWPNLSKSISTTKVYWEFSETCKMEHFLKNQLTTF